MASRAVACDCVTVLQPEILSIPTRTMRAHCQFVHGLSALRPGPRQGRRHPHNTASSVREMTMLKVMLAICAVLAATAWTNPAAAQQNLPAATSQTQAIKRIPLQR